MSQVHNTDWEWETIDLLPPTMVEGRPGTIRVYMPPRARNTSYGVLDYSVVVLAGPHHANLYLNQRIGTALAGHFDLHPRDFKVTAPDATIGDWLVEFLDIDTCQRAVREGFFVMANGVEVQLKKWTLALGMVRYSMPYRARVKLFGVPIYNINEMDINHLISGIGCVDIMTSVYVNGRFESLRVLIACHDTRNIPQELLMTTYPNAKVIRVQLEGFSNIENEISTPIPTNDSQPPSALWRAREVNEEENPRPAYHREGHIGGRGERISETLIIVDGVALARTGVWRRH